MNEQVAVESGAAPPARTQSKQKPGSKKLEPNRSTVFDLFAAFLIAGGHSLLALCFFFSATEERLVAEIARLGLPSPSDRRFRISSRADAWTSEQIQQLMLLWPTNLFATCIGVRIGRSASSVRYKAKQLGLPARNRTDLRRDIPDEAEALSLALLPAEGPKRKRDKIDNTYDADYLIGEHALHLVHPSVTAKVLGRTEQQIENRKHYLELPPLHPWRGRLLMEYDPNAPRADPFLKQGWLMRQCNVNSKNRFWAERKNGNRTARVTRKSKAYQAKLAGLAEGGQGDYGD